MSEAYVRGFGWKFGIQDPVAQRIIAGGVVAIVALLALRRGNFEAALKLAKGTAEITKGVATKVIESRPL